MLQFFTVYFIKWIANFLVCLQVLHVIRNYPGYLRSGKFTGPADRANEFILMHSIDGFIVLYETIWNEISIEGSCMFLCHKWTMDSHVFRIT